MGKLQGFKGGKTDSLVKRAASALIWLRKTGGESAFISWVELYAELTGVPVDKVNPDEVLERLRRKAYYVKAFLRESGYGWTSHLADRGMIRATAPGSDSAVHCMPYYHRRSVRASENFVNWSDRTVGNPSKIHRTKENSGPLEMLTSALPKHRAVLLALGSIVEIKPRVKAKMAPPLVQKKKAA